IFQKSICNNDNASLGIDKSTTQRWDRGHQEMICLFPDEFSTTQSIDDFKPLKQKLTNYPRSLRPNEIIQHNQTATYTEKVLTIFK
ncbi:MAG: hypothetical protein P8M29_06340, partial [Tateyamaria sp.]|nr:hypothetical protein [Tateyamaria sp.]